ncbi:MAG: hypothetical protein WC048_14725 [Rhizobium sp.]|jgi:hypothetical protein
MKYINISAIAIAIGLVFNGGAMAESMSKGHYKSLEKNIDAKYKTAQDGCGSFSGNANDICVAEAKGNRSVDKAELDDSYMPTIKTRYNVRIARAKADFSVAMEKCDDKAGNDKDVCVKEAKAAEIHEMANAKAQMKTSKADVVAIDKSAAANTKAMDKAVEAHNDAASDGRDADYAVAKEKCQALAGNVKDLCLSDAKVRFGQH